MCVSVYCTLFSFGDFSSHVFFWSEKYIEAAKTCNRHHDDHWKILCLSFISLIFNLSSSFYIAAGAGFTKTFNDENSL